MAGHRPHLCVARHPKPRPSSKIEQGAASNKGNKADRRQGTLTTSGVYKGNQNTCDAQGPSMPMSGWNVTPGGRACKLVGRKTHLAAMRSNIFTTSQILSIYVHTYIHTYIHNMQACLLVCLGVYVCACTCTVPYSPDPSFAKKTLLLNVKIQCFYRFAHD